MQDLDSKDEVRCGRASVNRTLSMCWRRHDRHGMTRRCCVEAPAMSPQSCQMLLALALGFALAGLALLIVAAPFLIMRTIVLGGGEALDRFQVVFLATLLAGFWSLMSGLALMMTLQALLA